MKMVDFEYAGITLSSMGLMLCNFDGSEEIVDIGNNISINQIKAPGSDKYMAVNYSYEEPLVVSDIQICKNGCGDNVWTFTDEEICRVVKWLNREKYIMFSPIYDDNSFSNDVHFYGTFNVQLVTFGNDVIGFNLTLTTNAPYGFGKTVEHSLDFDPSVNNGELQINVESNNCGYIPCSMTITGLEDGDLTIKNSEDEDNNLIIKNFKKDEIINFEGELKKINMISGTHKKIYNDFNYNFIKLYSGNGFLGCVNHLSANLKCTVNIWYTPIVKVGIIL